MACVLLVGSHPDMTRYVAAMLRSEGWDVASAVGPQAGLRALEDLVEVDAMVIGGPQAFDARGALISRLRERHPFAAVVFPTTAHGISAQIIASLGGDAQ